MQLSPLSKYQTAIASVVNPSVSQLVSTETAGLKAIELKGPSQVPSGFQRFLDRLFACFRPSRQHAPSPPDAAKTLTEFRSGLLEQYGQRLGREAGKKLLTRNALVVAEAQAAIVAAERGQRTAQLAFEDKVAAAFSKEIARQMPGEPPPFSFDGRCLRALATCVDKQRVPDHRTDFEPLKDWTADLLQQYLSLRRDLKLPAEAFSGLLMLTAERSAPDGTAPLEHLRSTLRVVQGSTQPGEQLNGFLHYLGHVVRPPSLGNERVIRTARADYAKLQKRTGMTPNYLRTLLCFASTADNPALARNALAPIATHSAAAPHGFVQGCKPLKGYEKLQANRLTDRVIDGKALKEHLKDSWTEARMREVPIKLRPGHPMTVPFSETTLVDSKRAAFTVCGVRVDPLDPFAEHFVRSLPPGPGRGQLASVLSRLMNQTGTNLLNATIDEQVGMLPDKRAEELHYEAWQQKDGSWRVRSSLLYRADGMMNGAEKISTPLSALYTLECAVEADGSDFRVTPVEAHARFVRDSEADAQAS